MLYMKQKQQCLVTILILSFKNHTYGAGVVVRKSKLALRMPESHMKVPVWHALSALLPVQLLASVPGKASEQGPCDPYVDQDEILGSWLWPDPLLQVGLSLRPFPSLSSIPFPFHCFLFPSFPLFLFFSSLLLPLPSFPFPFFSFPFFSLLPSSPANIRKYF